VLARRRALHGLFTEHSVGNDARLAGLARRAIGDLNRVLSAVGLARSYCDPALTLETRVVAGIGKGARRAPVPSGAEDPVPPPPSSLLLAPSAAVSRAAPPSLGLVRSGPAYAIGRGNRGEDASDAAPWKSLRQPADHPVELVRVHRDVPCLALPEVSIVVGDCTAWRRLQMRSGITPQNDSRNGASVGKRARCCRQPPPGSHSSPGETIRGRF
jgi:hypothetical protein